MYKLFKTICFVSLLLALAVLPAAVMAQDDAEAPADEGETETYTQGCAECHIDTVTAWQDGVHAHAFSNETFQEAWQENGSDSACLACHTTGYQPFSGEYTHANITCEACHGQTPADHPDEPLSVEPGLEVCAECHTTTYHEWSISAHGEAELACTSCHNPHPQGVRFGSTNELCMNCHKAEDLQSYAHDTHAEEDCTSCHWHRGEFDRAEHVLTGALSPSGHDAQVETLACLDCHENMDEEYLAQVEAGGEGTNTLMSLVRIQELEAEVKSVRAQGENISAVRLVQGVVVGLAFGAVLALGFARLRPGRVKE
jgi:hypothetical protein